jgi:hypothetical protein
MRKALGAMIAIAISTSAQAAGWQLSGAYAPISAPPIDKRQSLWLSVSDENGAPVILQGRAFEIESVGCVGQQYGYQCGQIAAAISEFKVASPGVYRIVFRHDHRLQSVAGIVVRAWNRPSRPSVTGTGAPGPGTQQAQLFLPRP